LQKKITSIFFFTWNLEFASNPKKPSLNCIKSKIALPREIVLRSLIVPSSNLRKGKEREGEKGGRREKKRERSKGR
jgi:hypothetical protein